MGAARCENTRGRHTRVRVCAKEGTRQWVGGARGEKPHAGMGACHAEEKMPALAMSRTCREMGHPTAWSTEGSRGRGEWAADLSNEVAELKPSPTGLVWRPKLEAVGGRQQAAGPLPTSDRPSPSAGRSRPLPSSRSPAPEEMDWRELALVGEEPGGSPGV
jgi:hypothetical protein